MLICFLATVIILLWCIHSLKSSSKKLTADYEKRLNRKEEIIALLRADMSALCSFTKSQVSQKSQDDFRFYYEIYGAADYDIPQDVYFVNYYVPVKGTVTNDKPYGDYTVYTPMRGNCYHSNKLCSSSFSTPSHIYDVAGIYRPCPKCALTKLYAPPEWYTEIKRIMDNHTSTQSFSDSQKKQYITS